MPHYAKLGWLAVFGGLILGIYAASGGSFHSTAPEFSLPEIDHGQVELSSYRGRPVLLVFWTTSCSICQQELPMLERLAPEFRSKGIAVLAIHLGEEGAARDFMDANRISFTSLVDSSGKVGSKYHVGGVPKLVLVGSDGKIQDSTSGWTSESVLRDWIDSASGS
jgi:cytochrome c biogenesis protein CcmG, thiol:disulfide interchange protein DsbE